MDMDASQLEPTCFSKFLNLIEYIGFFLNHHFLFNQ